MVSFSQFHRFFTKAKDSTGSINDRLVSIVPPSGTATDGIELVELLFIPDLSPRTHDHLVRTWVDATSGQGSVTAI
jgi:hypothetical protein